MLDVAPDSNTVAKTYTWGLDLSGSVQGAGGVGGLLAVTEHNETGDSAYYPTYDANGNVSEYIDDTDTVVAHYEYSPFGKITASSGSKSSDFRHRFSTKYQDDETALYYYGYRYYSNELGRWISRDPVREDSGLNIYAFAMNNSIGSYDFLGLIESDNYPLYFTDEERNKLEETMTKSCEDAGGTRKSDVCCCGGEKMFPGLGERCVGGKIVDADPTTSIEQASPGGARKPILTEPSRLGHTQAQALTIGMPGPVELNRHHTKINARIYNLSRLPYTARSLGRIIIKTAGNH